MVELVWCDAHQIREWDCPECGHTNNEFMFECSECGFDRREGD